VPSTNTLGRYQIVREIARSNDIVYEAVDPVMKRRVALKELQMPPNIGGEQRRERIERFYREARAAGALTHANIVTIYEVGEEHGRHFIAMEFLEGESLRDRLQKSGALPLDEAIRIAVAVADGLHFAHQHGVVHRDVKPDNVHMLPDGRVKITDFGIARITFEPTLTADGQIFGTPSYMSPEQVTGKGIDPRSDIFSLGVMLYEMASGRKPFTGDSVITITYNIMNLEPSPLAGIPPAAAAIVRRAMAKSPDQRYRSAAEIAAELRGLAARGLAPAGAGSLRPAAAAVHARMASLPAARGGVPYSGPGPNYPPPPPPGSARAGSQSIPRPAPAPLFSSSPRRVSPPGRAGRPPTSRMGVYAGPPPPAPAVAPGYPAAGRPLPGPMPRSAYRPPPPLISAEVRWFIGWLAVAVLVALLLVFIVWSALQGLSPQASSSPRPARGTGASAAAPGATQGEAQRSAGEALAQAEQYAQAQQINLARSYFEQAASIWRRRLEDPNLPAAERAEAQRGMQDAQDREAQALIQEGYRLRAGGETEKARAYFEEAQKLAPRGSHTAATAGAAEASLPPPPQMPGP
jgi:serine/threonine protein kinase